jgi:hypothetical protein
MPKQSGYFGMLLSRKTQALRPVRSLIAPVIASPRVPVATVEGPRPAVSVPVSAAPREVRAVDQVAAKVAPQMKPVSSIPEVRPTPAPEIRVIRETVAGAPKQVRTEVVHVAREAPKPRAPEFSQEKPAVEKPEPVGPKTVSVTEQIPVYLAAPEVAIETTVIAARSQPEAARPPVVRMETTIDWPPQLDAGQRNTVRVEVERQARERIAAVPAARSNGAQKVEVRVDQVNVRFDAPAQPRTAATRPAAESSFDGFFRARSLR